MKAFVTRAKRVLGRWTTMHRQSGKNWLSLILFVVRLKRARGFYLAEIHDNELDLRGKDYEDSFLNWREQKKYLDLLNPRKYYILARNKYLTHIALDALGIRDKSELICYYNPECDGDGTQIANSVKTVSQILMHRGLTEFVVKTTESSHGENVWVIKNIEYHPAGDAELVKFDGSTILLSELLKKEPLIFESLIRQTGQMSSFNPSSVNTIRFMTTLYPGNEARIIATFIKIGRSGRCVDNAGSGGNVDSGINIATGEITDPILFSSWRDLTKIDCHPDSGEQLKGVKIENWEEIKSTVLDFQKKLPFVKAAGWDIAITPDGPKVIEVNDMWDRAGQLFLGRGWKKEIIDCYNAWQTYYNNQD